MWDLYLSRAVNPVAITVKYFLLKVYRDHKQDLSVHRAFALIRSRQLDCDKYLNGRQAFWRSIQGTEHPPITDAKTPANSRSICGYQVSEAHNNVKTPNSE